MTVLTRSPESFQNEIAAAAALATDEVNRAADRVRRLFITPILGQEMIYMAKEAEARAYLAASPEPSGTTGWEADYPFIAAEIGATAPTPSEVATTYITLATQFRTAGAGLEQIRIGAIAAFDAATSIAEVHAARDQAITSIQTTFGT